MTDTRDPTIEEQLNYEQERKAEHLVQMRTVGMTYRQIAEHLGVSVSTAHNRVQMALQRQRFLANETRDDIREIELAKIDHIERDAFREATQGDMKAAHLLLSCIRLRRQYLKDEYFDAGIERHNSLEGLIRGYTNHCEMRDQEEREYQQWLADHEDDEEDEDEEEDAEDDAE